MLVQYVLAKSIKGISIKFSTDNKYTPGGNLNFAPGMCMEFMEFIP